MTDMTSGSKEGVATEYACPVDCGQPLGEHKFIAGNPRCPLPKEIPTYDVKSIDLATGPDRTVIAGIDGAGRVVGIVDRVASDTDFDEADARGVSDSDDAQPTDRIWDGKSCAGCGGPWPRVATGGDASHDDTVERVQPLSVTYIDDKGEKWSIVDCGTCPGRMYVKPGTKPGGSCSDCKGVVYSEDFIASPRKAFAMMEAGKVITIINAKGEVRGTMCIPKDEVQPLGDPHPTGHTARIVTPGEVRARKDAEHCEIKQPKHYTQGTIEVWDFIADQGLCFLAGNVIKYICRYRFKGTPVKDLQKARAYLDRLIAEEEARVSKPHG